MNKTILCLLSAFQLFSVSAFGATIRFPLESLTGTATARKITITPVNPISRVGTNLAVGGSLTLPATNTMPEIYLVTGKYIAAFDGLTGTLKLNVPDTNGVFMATDSAVSDGLIVYTYTTPLASGGGGTNIVTGIVNGYTNPVFAGSVGVTARNTYSSLNLDGDYRGLIWDSFGFTLGDYNAAGQLYIDDTSANFGGGLTVNGTLFSGAHSGDGSLLTHVPFGGTPSFTAPLTAQSVTAYGTGNLVPGVTTIWPHGNGWGQGDSPNCSPSQSPPYVTLTNWYPQVTNWNLANVNPGTGWWLAQSNFLQHPWISSTGLCLFVTGGVVGTDDSRVSNIWANAWNTNNLYIVESLQTSLQTNGSPGLANDTAWNNLMVATYGNHFLRVNSYMQTKTNGTALDAQSVASGVLPLSLYCTNGTTGGNYAHLNSVGYGYMGEALAIGVSNSVFGGVVGNGKWITNVPPSAIVGTALTNRQSSIVLTGAFNGTFSGPSGYSVGSSFLYFGTNGGNPFWANLNGQFGGASLFVGTNSLTVDSAGNVATYGAYNGNGGGLTNMQATNHLSGGSTPGQILTATSAGTAWSNAPSIGGQTQWPYTAITNSPWLTATTAASQIAGSNLVTSAQVATQVAGSNYLSAAQVATQVAGSNYLTGPLVSGSNYVMQSWLAGSNFVKQASLDGSNFVSTTTLANSNFISSTRLAGSNYADYATLATSNFISSARLGGSNYLNATLAASQIAASNLLTAAQVATQVAGSNYLQSLTGNAAGATNIQGTNVVVGVATWPGPTNTITMTGGDQLYQTSVNCSLSNAVQNGWTTLWVSNASGGNVVIYGPAGRYIGPGSTNALTLAAAHMAVVSVRVFGLTTNVATASEQ